MRSQNSKIMTTGSDTGLNVSVTIDAARENWFPAEIKHEKLGRPPIRAKHAQRWRSHQQRAFAAAVLHSIRIYEGLRPHELEIRAMLHARNMIDEQKVAICSTGGTGVRPTSAVSDASSAEQWLSDNAFIGGHERKKRQRTIDGHYRVCLTTDAVATRRSQINGRWRFNALEQLVAWVLLWADHKFELRWLGMKIGFGIFTSVRVPKTCRIQLQGIAEYDVWDPHAMMQLHPNASDRANGDYTSDTASVYGPVTMINAGCEAHSKVMLKNKDLGVGSKRVHAELLKGMQMGQQVLAAYNPPCGKCWQCPALGLKRNCRCGV